MWVANEDLHKVFIFDALTGSLLASIAVSHPIGIYFNEDEPSSVFVGYRNSFGKHDKNHTSHSFNRNLEGGNDANDDPSNGGVLRLDRHTKNKKMRYSLLGMKHPAGLASFEDVLFVADQTTQSIFSFNLTTSQFIRTIASKDDVLRGLGDLEHIILSGC